MIVGIASAMFTGAEVGAIIALANKNNESYLLDAWTSFTLIVTETKVEHFLIWSVFLSLPECRIIQKKYTVEIILNNLYFNSFNFWNVWNVFNLPSDVATRDTHNRFH